MSDSRGSDWLIFGATRNTGLALAGLVRASGASVAAMLRSGSDPAPLKALGVSLIEGDAFNPADCASAVARAEPRVIVSLLGGKSADGRRIDGVGNLNVIAAAQRASRLERFLLVTSMGCGEQATLLSEPARRLLGEALAAKTEAEAGLRASALPWTVLRPTGLSHALPTGGWQLLESAGAPGAYLPRADLAAAIVEVARDPQSLRRVMSVLGPAPQA